MSNTNSAINKKKRTPRTTFGIKDEKGNRKKDIIKAFVASRIITCEDFDIGMINYQGVEYILHTDKKVRTELGNWGNCRCIISFQIRTRERMAIARIYNDEKDKEWEK